MGPIPNVALYIRRHRQAIAVRQQRCAKKWSADAAAHVKNHEWAVVPDTGHAIAWERPDLFNEKVLAFVGRH